MGRVDRESEEIAYVYNNSVLAIELTKFDGLQILWRRFARAKYLMARISAANQARQLDIQGWQSAWDAANRDPNSTLVTAQIRIAYEWTEDFVIKYLWSAAGYCLISVPVFLTRRRDIGIQADGPGHTDIINNRIANRTESASRSRLLPLRESESV